MVERRRRSLRNKRTVCDENRAKVSPGHHLARCLEQKVAPIECLSCAFEQCVQLVESVPA